MDSFFTSLNKRQSMLLLTAVTFGGQESVGAMEHLPSEEGELLRHRAQELLQIPRDTRIPALVQEIKRLVKDRRGQLWSADPERLATLLQRERGALMEIVLRALPAPLAESVRAHLPAGARVKLGREVRPQVLDIVRWKLEEALARESGASQDAGFKFSDVLQLQQRELLTMCDRLGARVLGPALAGLPEAEREGLLDLLPPDLKLLATKSVAANAPRKLPEEDARAQLELHDGLRNPASAIRSAGVQRLARACVAQSAEFAARMLEKYRGEFGGLIAKWVREERLRPTARGDGGRTDIVMDLERLASRGLITRPVRLASPPPQRQSAVLPPPPGARKAAAREAAPAPARDGSAIRPAPVAAEGAGRQPSGASDGSVVRPSPRAAEGSVVRQPPGAAEGSAIRQAPARDGSAVRPAPARDGSAVRPAPARDGSAIRPAPAREGSAVRQPPAAREGAPARPPASSREAGSARPGPVLGPPRGLTSRRPPDAEPAVRRDFMAERAARRAGAMSSREREPSQVARPEQDGAADGSAVHRLPPRREPTATGSPRREAGGPEPRPSRPARPAPDGARIGPPPSRLGQRSARPQADAGPEASAVRERSRVAEPSRAPPARPRPEASLAHEEPEGSRVFRSRSSVSISAVRLDPSREAPSQEARPPRVLAGRSATSSMPAVQPAGGEGTSVQRRPRAPTGADRPVPPGAGGRGPKGGTR
ncbi:hypothetical protein LY474_02295 [Myxococcus stipitatus]|uniref:hypothetical protein n=1 Tax=Myxococcus stipitatus TaxID=83455 RepID=UPI001F35C100|nr:hypothetical protein [Myxococcus stipitatus]MCE9666631.1 hypothetical protein [Myxococcus stipitatus]